MIFPELTSCNELARTGFCKGTWFADVKKCYSVDFTGLMLMYCMWQASLKAFCGIVKLMMQDSGCSSAHSYKKFLCKMNFPSIPN